MGKGARVYRPAGGPGKSLTVWRGPGLEAGSVCDVVALRIRECYAISFREVGLSGERVRDSITLPYPQSDDIANTTRFKARTTPN